MLVAGILGIGANGLPAAGLGMPGPGFGCPERCSHFYSRLKGTTFWDFPFSGEKAEHNMPPGPTVWRALKEIMMWGMMGLVLYIVYSLVLAGGKKMPSVRATCNCPS